MKKKIFSLFIVLTLSVVLFAQDTTETPFEKRANDIVKILNDPKDLEKVFTEKFLAQVPVAQVAQISEQLTGSYGKALKVEKINKKDDFSGEILILFEKNVVGKFVLNIESTGENLIDGLIITGIEQKSDSLQGIVDELKKLSGKTSFVAAKLNGKDFQSLMSHNADEQFAVGSTFKVYVLAELVRQISEGKRKWSDVVELKQFSLPSGQMQDWENGSPVTLHTLASMMISVSDNTATDQLIKVLGRENIEKMLSTAGNSKPEKSRPFMMTSEMFRLKGLGEDFEYAKKYVVADEKGKREILNNEIAKLNFKDIQIKGFLAKPTYISEIEWFASGNDLVRLMIWLRQNSEKSPMNLARGVMSINKALPEETANKWNYIGFKGGSETGVISMTYLLQSKKGEWFVVTSSWNDEKNAVKEGTFATLIQSAVKILETQTR